MKLEIEKSKKLLEEKYNTQLEKMKKEFDERDQNDIKIKRITETRVEEFKKDVEINVKVEHEKHETE